MILTEVLPLVCNCQLKVSLVRSIKTAGDKAKANKPGPVVKLTMASGKMTAVTVKVNRLMVLVTNVRSTRASGKTTSDMAKANLSDLVARQSLVLGKTVSLTVQPRSKRTAKQLRQLSLKEA